MHLRDWLIVLTSPVSSLETIWAREGDPVRIECTRKGEMIRFEEPEQVLAIKFRGSKATYLAPKKSVWTLDESNNADTHSLKLRISSMSSAAVTSLSCVDEMGSQIDYQIKLLKPPKVTFGLMPGVSSVLKEGNQLQVYCQIIGGSPAPSLNWSNSVSDSKFDETVDKGQSLAGGDVVIKSMVTYTTEAKFHQQYFTCNVKQANVTTQYPLEKVYVEYKPRDLSFQINPEVDENNLLEAPSCTAQSYPESKISYQISKTQKEWREFKPSSEELSLSDNSSFVRCKATNSQGVIFSDAAKLKVFKMPTQVVYTTPIASSTPAPKSPRLVSSKESDGDNQTPSQLATQVEKSGKNGIILSVIGSGAFLLVVLMGIVLRRFVRRGQGQTYKTDELSELDEGISLHDPELEAHKKKEYFM